MSTTIRHGFPLLATGQAQKDVTHNEALAAIDRRLHPGVISRTLAVPPAAPTAGDSFIVGPGPSGAWAGEVDNIAGFDGAGWTFFVPVRGCLAWIGDEACFSVYDDGWSMGGWPAKGLAIGGRQVLGAAPLAVAAPTGGTTVDGEARSALAALLAALRDQGILL